MTPPAGGGSTEGKSNIMQCVFLCVSFASVTQTDILWESEGENATMHCSHTYGALYYQMYWYRQRPGENVRQIVFITPDTSPDFESDFKTKRFGATKLNFESGTLTVGELQPGDSGVYFCAVSETQ
uniref:Ig-like domain-containing protein n=1 Tax=Neogobius melanostomus TaxID=47308 RepID=A0A8C6S533_9GOBI